jgi:hypothetical protein
MAIARVEDADNRASCDVVQTVAENARRFCSRIFIPRIIGSRGADDGDRGAQGSRRFERDRGETPGGRHDAHALTCVFTLPAGVLTHATFMTSWPGRGKPNW